MRLDKYLSKALKITRNEARELIKAGLITVNNEAILKKDFLIDENNDKIYYQKELLTYHHFKYLMINKPQGIISAVRDKYKKTIIDLVGDKDLFPVGRLDIDTEGLMILTNNGKLAHRITSPKHNIWKEYYVEVEEPLTNADVERFARGLEIRDGKNKLFLTKPAKLKILSSHSGIVEISEGKFHQIKRMFSKLNNKVLYLKRISFAGIKLDENLKSGEYRELTKEEINHLQSL